MKNEKDRIKAPEGIVKLVEKMWKLHKAGVQQPTNNVFWVDLPPLTQEEKSEIKTEDGVR